MVRCRYLNRNSQKGVESNISIHNNHTIKPTIPKLPKGSRKCKYVCVSAPQVRDAGKLPKGSRKA